MGTPDFAEESLRALLEAGEDVAAVFTQPDKPRGRGMQESFSPVKTLAVERGIPVYQPVTFKDGAATELLRTLAPELLVVVAYGRILPQTFLDVAKYGSINVHGSLLPKYRGAAPIQWAVLNGDKTTGVSVQYMAATMDAGDVIASRETEIGEFETSGELFDRLKTLGAELLVETVRKIASGDVVRVPQNEADATYTKMLHKEMCPIDWNKSPREIVVWIRGRWPRRSSAAYRFACSARNTPIRKRRLRPERSYPPEKRALKSPAAAVRPFASPRYRRQGRSA